MKTNRHTKLSKRKLPLLLLFVTLFLSPAFRAQVTIGSTETSNPGSLLDLKQTQTTGVNASRGLAMPRVQLSDLKKLKMGENEITDTEDGGEQYEKHIGLSVYNHKDDYCSLDPIYKGLYVWNGTKWQYMGKGVDADNADEVNTFTDNRSQLNGPQTYRYREFFDANGVSVGEWMTENLRFIPADPNDPNYLHTAERQPIIVDGNGKQSVNTTKCWAYPWEESRKYSSPGLWICPYDKVKATEEWSPRNGILYNWYFAANRKHDNKKEGQGDEQESVAVVHQGVCPDGWHLPSDREWNDLEEAIYNNPTPYSWYETDYNFNPPTWDGAEWEKIYYGLVNRGSDTDQGHGLAMISECFGVGEGEYKGRSLSAAQGGFDILIVGSAADGESRDYGRYTQFWTASAHSNGNSWRRQFFTGRTGDGDSQKVMRGTAGRYGLYTVRCKKD
ncbi:uncharacterized protein (TIGR02145 family) [Dysgonomonas sp. PH5-45]|uniref:FISUMP domain-containing protein n=1 Tax=unclassified Dysgonomonas TaxID=2630389 RepID=UPI002474AF36|nr:MULTISPECIES: FISUMP domain-containing protein [unclassified Dysgonomonas]MDH6353778.1 uncharacterized protein (TIGR02145 family) [Dysgonomonas sp. PH5-45]MDH6386681.1 uncharacterized protein (TIGR02145 family) [Dysgonomonas sp. PH5-37]